MNWKQELAAEITAIDGLNANPATLTYRINDQGGFFGGLDKIIAIPRQITVKAPEPVSERYVDGTERKSGDFTCVVDFAQLKAAHEPQNADPEITINRVPKRLEDVRPFNAQIGNNIRWGVDIGDDTLTIGGDVWLIVGVEAIDWLDGEPAKFRLILRK